MTVTQALTFHPTLLTGLVSLVALGVVIGLAWLAMRRDAYRRSTCFLESLRVLLVAAAIVLLNQPEWTEEYQPAEKPTVVVLGDRSYSMRTRDENQSRGKEASQPSVAFGPPVTREEKIQPLLEAATWKALDDRFDVVLHPFSNNDPNGSTDLAGPLGAALKDHAHLRAVVLASDGDWNSGGSPLAIASQLRMRGIPIIGVPVGSTEQLPDLEVLSLDLPTFGIVGKPVNIPVTIESSLPLASPVTVTLQSSDGTEQHKELVIQAMGRTTTTFVWKPSKMGDYQVSVSVPPRAEELLPDNNQRTASIAIREERLKVLVVESFPRWEYRYLRNALTRDPGVDVSCLLFHPGLNKVGGGDVGYLAEFPSTLEELSSYDVVFLGDVGTVDGQLTVEHCRLLKGLIQQQASGLILMPGWQGNQLSLVDSPLADLFPIVFETGQPEGWGSRTASHFELTEVGRRSLLTKLADTSEDNLSVWENLPGFQWYAPVLRAKAGTEVLCVHQDATNRFGRIPLLVTQPFGVGKVLFMGTDGAWRWRKGVEDRYHYRFWGQVIRWMAYQRNMAKGESMRLYYSPEQPSVRQTIFMNANVVDKSGEPLSNGEVTALIEAPSGATQSIRFTGQGEEWGAFSAKYTPLESGVHRVTLRSPKAESSLETSFLVQGKAVERLGKPARPEVLDELTRLTRGRLVRPEEVETAVAELQQLELPPAEIRRWQLWSHASIAATLIGAFALFWIGRKWAGHI